MSLLGHDALGHWALGHAPDGAPITLQASVGSFAFTGNAATFTISEAAAVGSFALTGVSASFSISWPETVASYILTGNAAALLIGQFLPANTGAFTLTGQSATISQVWSVAPGAFTLTGPDANLVRTGDNYEFKLGGVGHYKLERERAKQLARITRNPPPPIDTRTAPQFPALVGPYSAPTVTAHDLEMKKIDRLSAQVAAAQAAKKRREIEAILLLAS